ncbi:hypothetical protein BAUCODRAFT_23319 [Baudoinia panamericana UAMH 10762]|uniref:Imidazoleglycerol-phosphate dehydratase n=1 Tax=Baudoinia panamericana (strain UAMH 10762) TaxID=717646 RepID=M2NCI6_BAUPA|nr:uncharacterized protein BAUCODRAFT_23319 [Baudoinia panamericana UAMH 10762]EMC96894.1 hypothetical protein BAUCODRAFT_23319 [Baudoinia panamericana UAMH 10762]
MVRKHGSLVHDEELNTAAWVAARGAGVGAAKWGILSAAAAGLGFAFSPIYRSLTFQFKVFLQMSGMTIGSMIEADKRLRAHERLVRREKTIARDAEVWRRYEEDYLDKAATERMQRQQQQQQQRDTK